MALITDVQGLLQAARGFYEARLLLTAYELGLFRITAQGASADEVSRECDVEIRAAEILLDALSSIGILAKRGEIYATTPSLASHLDESSPNSVHHALGHALTLWSRWNDLTDIARRGHPINKNQPDSTQTEHFIGAMEVFSRQRAEAMAAEISLEGAKTMLDLGGGPGTYSIAFCKSNPELKAVVFDLDGVTAIADRHIRKAKLADRIFTKSGDYLVDPIEGSYDFIWMSSILHMHSPSQCRWLINKATGALNKGGKLIVREFLLNELGDGPPRAALFAVNMLVSTEGGRSYKASEISNWMIDAGLSSIQIQLSDEDGLVTGSKA